MPGRSSWRRRHKAPRSSSSTRYASRTAKQADWHIAIRPGTDGALALGMMQLDHRARAWSTRTTSSNYTVGFEELKERASKFPPERVAEITGIPAEDIRKLAREYATSQPSVIRMGVAIERQPRRRPDRSARSPACRRWSVPGAMSAAARSSCRSGSFRSSSTRICRPDWIRPARGSSTSFDLGAALTGELALDPPIDVAVRLQLQPGRRRRPDRPRSSRGLMREDLFTVVSEQFVTDTARYADMILPATMQGEQYDLMVTWGHLYMMLNLPAIAAPGECVANIELFRGWRDDGLRRRYWDLTDDEMLLEFYDWSHRARRHHPRPAQGQGLAAAECRRARRARTACRGRLQDPSGKCEFKSSLAEDGDFVVPVWRSMLRRDAARRPDDPVPAYIPPSSRPPPIRHWRQAIP